MHCTFTWAITLLINGHDRQWFKGSTECEGIQRVSDGDVIGARPALHATHVVSDFCSAELFLENVDDAAESVAIRLQLNGDCPRVNVEHWHLSVSDLSESFNVESGLTKAFEPVGFGAIVTGQFEVDYPSMQFSALLHATGACVYLGVHDGLAFPKKFGFDGNSTINTSYRGSGEIDEFLSLPFKIWQSVDNCTWKSVSDQYRKFAVNTTWYARGLQRRDSRPDWISDAPLWVNSHWDLVDTLEMQGGKPETVLDRVNQLQKRIGSDIPLILHWYEWDRLGFEDDDDTICSEGKVCGFDSHYPNYFPAKSNFAEAVQSLKEAGVRTVPYINGRIFDQSLDQWKETAPQAAACKGKSGQFYTEEYGNNVKFATMCPATYFWQQTLTDVSAGVMVTAPDISGIYIDQIGAVEPVHCYDATHDHEHGGGSSWASGYVKMLENVRETVGGDRLVITESNVEQLIGSVDTFLSLVAYYRDVDEIVPAFQYIYPGGVFSTAGSIFYTADVTQNNGHSFVRKLMKQLVLGTQLGWFALGGRTDRKPTMGMLDYLITEENSHIVDVLVYLVKLRMNHVISRQFRRGGIIDQISSLGYVWYDGQSVTAIACNSDSHSEELQFEIKLPETLRQYKLVIDSLKEGNWVTAIIADPSMTLVSAMHVEPKSCSVLNVYPETTSVHHEPHISME